MEVFKLFDHDPCDGINWVLEKDVEVLPPSSNDVASFGKMVLKNYPVKNKTIRVNPNLI
jgi:hypothetical protein